MRPFSVLITRTPNGRWLRGAVFAVLGAAALFTPAACGRTRGPVEQVGHDIDEAADDVSDDVDEAVHDATHH